MPKHPKKKASGTNAPEDNFEELAIRRLTNSLGLANGCLAQFVIRLPDGSLYIPPRAKWRILIKAVVELFCARFAPGSVLVCIADPESRFVHLNKRMLRRLGVVLDRTHGIPDLIVYDAAKNWLLLFEVLVSAASTDGKRREELSKLIAGCTASVVFVTVLESRAAMRTFLPKISWKTAVWVADEPNHLIHFDGKQLLGPYPEEVSPRGQVAGLSRCSRHGRRRKHP
jgi:hypothetical protein